MFLRSKIEITALGSSTLLIKTVELNILKPYFDLKMYAEIFKFTFYMLIFWAEVYFHKSKITDVHTDVETLHGNQF